MNNTIDINYPASLTTILENGGVAVIPTDTLYGLVGSARNEETVNRIYRLRNRPPEKPCIILIANVSDILKFGVAVSSDKLEKLDQLWPNPVSIVFRCIDDAYAYLHRGTQTLAFRIPDNEKLRALLQKTGPLLAPSANIAGQAVATDVIEARAYFGDAVDMYLDAGKLEGAASTVISLVDGVSVLREGALSEAKIRRIFAE